MRPQRPRPAPTPPKGSNPDLIDRASRLCIEELAHEYLLSGSYTVAEALYAGLVEARPGEGRYLLGWGLSLERQGQRAEARRAFDRVRKTCPDDPLAYVNIAEMYLESGDLGRAQRYLEAARQRSDRERPEGRKIAALLTLLRLGERSA